MGLSSLSVICSSLLLKRYRAPMLVDDELTSSVHVPSRPSRMINQLFTTRAKRGGGEYAFAQIKQQQLAEDEEEQQAENENDVTIDDELNDTQDREEQAITG